MKMTLLEIVQNILSAMDAEEISSISDTIESQQVAEEVKTTYYENFGNFQLRSRFDIIQLEALADSTDKPNILKVPANVDQTNRLFYNKNTVASPDYYEVIWCEPEDFIKLLLSRTSSIASTVVKFPGTDAVPYRIMNDQHPTYYTSFDNEHYVFDSYNSTVDSTLQNSKTMVWAEVLPTWTASDTFTPDLEARFFPMLLAESKSASWVNYKGVANSKEEQRARRQKVAHQNNRFRVDQEKEHSSKNYGRS